VTQRMSVMSLIRRCTVAGIHTHIHTYIHTSSSMNHSRYVTTNLFNSTDAPHGGQERVAAIRSRGHYYSPSQSLDGLLHRDFIFNGYK